jgi:23S rRNA (pseudouridine1915-N3)-methyltransferase
MQIKILWVGKTKNPSIKSLALDYFERVRRLVPCEIIEARDMSKKSAGAAEAIAREGEELARYVPDSGRLIALDEKGKEFSSQEFARWLESEQNSGARSIAFVIGGPEGLSSVISNRANLILSLGKMTWTHEMCRVLLLEQIYRAFCIMRRIPYHRGDN